MPQPVQDDAGRILIEPDVDQTTARKMIDDAIARWNKELSSGSGNGELYKRWQHHQVSGNRFMKEPCWGDHKDQPEGEMLEKLKAIEFGPILESAMRLTNSGKLMGDTVKTQLTATASMTGDFWQDQNGQTAIDKINALKTAGTQYTDAVNRFASHLAGFANESKKCIQRLVDFAGRDSENYFQYLANDEVDIHHFAEAIDEIDESLINGETDNEPPQPYNLAIARSNTPGLIIWDNFETWYSDVEKGRLDKFCENYTNGVGTFRRLIKECYTTIDGHLQNLLNASSGLPFQPFAKLDELAKGGDKPKDGTQEPPPKEKEPEEKKPGSGGPGPGSGGPGPGSGGPGPGSGGPVSGSTPPPPPAPPEPSTDDPKAVDPGTTDPSDVPGPPGSPTDTPGAGTGETVTIEEGGKKISVTSPDSEGHVKVTVDDGTGQPKTYDMDFSQPAGAGTPGAGTPGAGTPGQPQQPMLGPDGQPVLGPDGQPQTMPAPAAETLTPGPDGKIVLEDGNVTITAEHPPGQPDVVKLTVDDGTGEPATYTLDYSDPGNPTAEPAKAGFDGQQVEGARHAAQAQGFGGSFETDSPRQDFAGAAAGASAFGGTAEAASFGGGPAEQQPLAAGPGSDHPVQTTSTQAVGDFGGSGDAGFGGSSWSTQGDLLSGGDDLNPVAPAAGEAGLAAIPDDGGQHAQPNQAASGMGGMPMMGGMGAGGGGGGDIERSGGQWSVTGDLFADENEPARIAGVLDEDVR